MATEKQKLAIWNKARKVRGKNPNVYRRDDLGNEIYFSSYGDFTEMGWEIDHKRPPIRGGSESIRNKRPLQTLANRRKGKKYPTR